MHPALARALVKDMFQAMPNRSFRFWDVYRCTEIAWPVAQKILAELASEGILQKRGNGWYRWAGK